MNADAERSNTDRELPLTEPVRADVPGLAIGESMIRSLVDAFYETIRADDLLGPIFARYIVDWSAHLPKMYDFWSTVVLRTGRYAGRPLEVHQRLPGLTPLHFDRWITLWKQTVARTVPPAAQNAFVIPAERMALSMSAALIRGADSATRA